MRLLDRIMRTNANSRSLRCGQAFICHALAAAHRRVQPRTVWNLTYAIRRPASPRRASLTIPLPPRPPPRPTTSRPLSRYPLAVPSLRLLPRISERPRRPCTLPQLSATVISRGYFCSRIALPLSLVLFY